MASCLRVPFLEESPQQSTYSPKPKINPSLLCLVSGIQDATQLAFVGCFFSGPGIYNKIAVVDFWTAGGLAPSENALAYFTDLTLTFTTADCLLGGASGFLLDYLGPARTGSLGLGMVAIAYWGFLPGSPLSLRLAMVLQGSAMNCVTGSIFSVGNLFVRSKFVFGLLSSAGELGTAVFVGAQLVINLGASYASVVLGLALITTICAVLFFLYMPPVPFPIPVEDDEESQGAFKKVADVAEQVAFQHPDSPDPSLRSQLLSRQYVCFSLYWLLAAFTSITYSIAVDLVFRQAGVERELGPYFEGLIPFSVLFGIVTGYLFDVYGIARVTYVMVCFLISSLVLSQTRSVLLQYVGATLYISMKGSMFTLLCMFINEKFHPGNFGTLLSVAATSLGVIALTVGNYLNSWVKSRTPDGASPDWSPVLQAQTAVLILALPLLYGAFSPMKTLRHE